MSALFLRTDFPTADTGPQRLDETDGLPFGIGGPREGSAHGYAHHSRRHQPGHVLGQNTPDRNDRQRDPFPPHPFQNRPVSLGPQHGSQIFFGRRIAERTEADIVGLPVTAPGDLLERIGRRTDNRSFADDTASLGGRHIALSEMHAVGPDLGREFRARR